MTRAQTETDDIFLPLLVQAYTGCEDLGDIFDSLAGFDHRKNEDLIIGGLLSEIVDCSTLDFNFVKNGDPEKVIPGKMVPVYQ